MPDAPVVDGIEEAAAGASGTNGITSDTTSTINGTVEAGSTVEVFRDGVSLGTTVALSDGTPRRPTLRAM